MSNQIKVPPRIFIGWRQKAAAAAIQTRGQLLHFQKRIFYFQNLQANTCYK